VALTVLLLVAAALTEELDELDAATELLEDDDALCFLAFCFA
jgi:hypothetical protein